MKRHVQTEGVRRWAGEHIIDLQAEPFKVIDAFFEEYGNGIIKGCEVMDWEDGTFSVSEGLVALQGTDPEGNATFKVAPFAGVTEVTLPAYFVLRFEVVEREYVDEKMHPIYYEYRAELLPEKPVDEPCLEIDASGAARFLDVTGVTHKLDKDGDGKEVVVSFEEAEERENVESGETLSGLFGKVRKWFAGLQAVAFSGKTEDLTDDAEHRLVTDDEKNRWNDTFTQQETDSKDAQVLKTAQEYADNRVTDLGSDVYRKSEVYTKQEADTRHEGDLAEAKKYATDRISELVNGSPAALDTLYEIANALNNDPNFATTIMALINGKADTAHKHTKSQITDFPTSMPASDVYAWAKASSKPTYTYSEVGAAAAGHNHDATYQPKGSYAAAEHNHDTAYAAKTHSHTKAQITDFPVALKNPSALTIKVNGSTKSTYDGSVAKEVDIAVETRNARSVSASTTLTGDDYMIFSTASSDITITLPTTNRVIGRTIIIRKCGSGNITVSGTQINGWSGTKTSCTLKNGDMQIFVWTGSYWTNNYMVYG